MNTSTRSLITKGVFVVITVAALVMLWKFLPVNDWLRTFIKFVDGLGFWGPLIYSPIYILAAIVGVPRTALNVGAGILFTYPIALAVVLVSAAIDYVITFQIARNFAQDWVKKKLESFPQAADILELAAQEGFKLVFLIRLNPFIPAVIKGYGLGATDVPMRTYLPASLLGFFPIACAHVYLGWLGGMSMMDSADHPSELKLALMIGGAVVSVVMVVLITWYGKKKLKQHSDKKSVTS